ncbi:glucagon b [Thunnus albacares]|uniref:glucagon b n=1 Tax=Thunnus albacares TaxID=8236 RepID=UPI001CF70255|nr:glucagon b [Thunnus albacares]
MKQLEKPGRGRAPINALNNPSLRHSIERSTEAQTMKNAQSLAGLLLLIIIQSSWQVPDQDTDRNSMLLNENSMLTEPIELQNMKRHSEGTFSNDYSKYLETRRAQDFVQWLKNSKRNGGLFRRHADGTYTSDVSSYLQDQAAKEFVSWLKTGRGRRE